MKRALIVGINYTGTSNELHGCLNDANDMFHIVKDVFGFDEVIVLLEEKATTKNIKSKLLYLKMKTTENDTLYFVYSGHGAQVPDKSEKDGYMEIICPFDFDWNTHMITDDWFAGYLTDFKGMWISSFDCCHSASNLRSIGFLGKPRFIPNPNTQRHFTHCSKALIDTNSTYKGISLSGCQENQTSADAYINNRSCGAFTFFLTKILKENNYQIDYESLINLVREGLRKKGFSQVPCLECKEEDKSLLFLSDKHKSKKTIISKIKSIFKRK